MNFLLRASVQVALADAWPYVNGWMSSKLEI